LVAAVLFGVLLPALLIWQSYQAMGRLDDLREQPSQIAAPALALPAEILQFRTANDYAIVGLAILEGVNYRALLNKQRMKVAVMNIGFAISCIGLLLLVFGFDSGGYEISGSSESLGSVNIKVASSGIAVFVFGAAIAAAGGLIPNTYQTLSLPSMGAVQVEARGITEGSVEEFASKLALCESGTSNVQDRQSCIVRSAVNSFSRPTGR